MKEIKENQIQKLLDDITTIKSVIKQNRPLLRELMMPKVYRQVALGWGISIIFFSLIFFFMTNHYGSFSHIPRVLFYILIGAVILDMCFLGFLKIKSMLAHAKRIKIKMSLKRIFMIFISSHIIHIFIPMIILMLFFILFFIVSKNFIFLIPTVSIGQGLLFNLAGNLAELKTYLFSGYWLIVTGVVSIILLYSLSVWLILSITMGLGFILFGFMTFLEPKAKEE